MHFRTRWELGSLYGPVLTQSELYLLNPRVELHPVLANLSSSFRLVFNLLSGQIGGYNDSDPNIDLPFHLKDEAATLPKMTELYIICPYAPWCTRVYNSYGVTMRDVCVALWIEYSQISITTEEYATLSPVMKVSVRRTALSRESGAYTARSSRPWASGMQISRIKRIDLLRENVFFHKLERNDAFARKRLGFAAPNIFVMHVFS